MTIVKQLRDPLWMLHAESRQLSPGDIRKWKAKLAGLDNGRKFFLGWDFAATFPDKYPKGASVPGGTGLDALTVTINTIGTDGVSIKLGGLPNGYAGKVGDMISISYGGSPPTQLALLQAVEDFSAGGSGVSTQFEVRAAIPAGVSVGDAVKLHKPSCHMMISPGSISAPKDSTARGTITFDAIQVPTI